MHCISNERYIFTLLTDTFKLENNTKFKKWCTKKGIFNLYFSVVRISSNNVLGSLKFCMHLHNTPLEGTVSQIFYLCLSFYVMSKNG